MYDSLNIWCSRNNFENYYLAISGGVDSIVMLDIFYKLFRAQKKLHQINIIHINHGIHASNNAQSILVKSLSKKYGLNFIHKDLNIGTIKTKVEETARIERYQAMAFYVKQHPKSILVCAHHNSDRLETIFLNMLRGCGLSGLIGMRDITDIWGIKVARPFLSYSKNILIEYAKNNKLDWIEDVSNNDNSLLRNNIRNNIINNFIDKEKLEKNIKNLSENIFSAYESIYYLAKTSRIIINDTIDLSKFNDLPENIKLSILHIWLHKKCGQSPTSSQLANIIHEMGGNAFCFKFNNFSIRKHQDFIVIVNNNDLWELDCIQRWENWPNTIKSQHYSLHAISAAGNLKPPNDNQEIIIKKRIGGEKIYLNKQHKSVKKILQSIKMPVWQRSQLPLIYYDNELVCIPGVVNACDSYRCISGYLIKVENCFFQMSTL